MIGRINSVQSLGTVDGPGVRFVVFMQGCPLRCGYCHNPDTWDSKGGKEITTEELFAQVKRYKSYFGKDGGITVSGGEPLLQADFVYELFSLCKSENIHTVLDTSGCILNDSVKKLLSVTDMCLLDYKMTNDEDYRKYTGCSLEKVESFLKELNDREIITRIRQVIVSGINDNEESIGRVYGLPERYSCIKETELLRFRKLCIPKYENLGIPFPFKDIPETTEEELQRLKR